ncbi:MAG TPA: hypothetical protein VD846_10410 [Allosphingosinicella sp.]|nr:hypothetical protein [Allosphingosinicella sp.]
MMTSLLLLAAAAGGLDGETPFKASQRGFADAAACKAFLATRAGEARGEGFDAVEGPYELAAGDVRIHTVRAEGKGHRIDEQRCLGAALSGRSWRHSLEDEKEEEEAFTAESAARSAPWLKKAPGGQ